MTVSPPPPGPSSKFRHAQGTILHRDSHITNLKGLNHTTPGESDGFCANRLHVAVPLLSSGGQVAVLEVRALPHQGYFQVLIVGRNRILKV